MKRAVYGVLLAILLSMCLSGCYTVYDQPPPPDSASQAPQEPQPGPVGPPSGYIGPPRP